MNAKIPDRQRHLENALVALRTFWVNNKEEGMREVAEQLLAGFLSGTKYKWKTPKRACDVLMRYGKSADTAIESLKDDAEGLWQELKPFIHGIKGSSKTQVNLRADADDIAKVLDHVQGKRFKSNNGKYYVDVTKSDHIVWKQKDIVWDGATWRNANDEMLKHLYLTAYIDSVGYEPTDSALKKTILMARTRGRPLASDNPKCRDWFGSVNLVSGKRLVGARFANGTLQLLRPTRDFDDWTAEFIFDSIDTKPDKTIYWVAPNDYEYATILWNGENYEDIFESLENVAPQFSKFLDHISSYEDSHALKLELKIRYMQMMGQIVCRDNRHQKMWCLIGTGGTGKSVTQNLAIELVGGLDNIDGGKFSSLAEDISVLNLVGKALVTVSELITRPYSGVAADNWDQAWHNSKAITGGDAVKLRQFFKDTTGSVRLHTNYLMAGNEMPSFSKYRNDASAAARRLMPFSFKVEAKKQDDMLVSDITENELGFVASAAFQIYTCEHGAWHTGIYSTTPTNQQMLDRAVTSMWQPLVDLFVEGDEDDAISTAAVMLLAQHVLDWTTGDIAKKRLKIQGAVKDFFNMEAKLPKGYNHCQVMQEHVNGAWFPRIRCADLTECQSMIAQQKEENEGKFKI